MNFCNGKLVELLISSNICRYTEFRAVDKVFTIIDGEVDIVPGSRSDVFTKKNVSIIEKRLLMKFMTQCIEYDKPSDEKNDFLEFPEDGKFIELMKQQRLPPKLIHYILYSMCMGNDELNFKDGITRIRTYLTSIGRYGNTAFLFPMYGCGEIPQCFCRLCAVFGGVYCLSKTIDSVKIINDEKVQVQCGEEIFTAKKLVHGLGSNILNEELTNEFISRAIIITASPFGGSSVNSEMDGGGAVLLYHPIEGKSNGITMIQLSHFSGCCPKGLCKLITHSFYLELKTHIFFQFKTDLFHLSTSKVNGAKNDFDEFINNFFRNDADPSEDFSKPTILYQTYFEIPSSVRNGNLSENQNGPIFTCCGPFSELDYDESILQSKLLYEKMYPDCEFLPKAPEPDEIIFGDEDPAEGNVNLGVLADLVDVEKEQVDDV